MKLSENGKKKLKSILRAVMFAALYVVVLPILGLLLGVAICNPMGLLGLLLVSNVVIPVFYAATFLIVFWRAVRRGRPSYLAWLSCYAPMALSVPLDARLDADLFMWLCLSAFAVSAASWLSAVALLFRARKFKQAVSLLVFIPIVVFAVFFASLILA